MKRISAVITTYKRPEPLQRAIESVLSQRHTPVELIVVDNAGQDEARTVAEKYAGSGSVNIRYVVERTPGVSAARNRGLAEAKEPYVAFLEDDDIWVPTHLEDFQTVTRSRTDFALFGGMRARLQEPNKLILPGPESKLFSDYASNDDTWVRRKGPLIRPFFTPSMSESVVVKAHAWRALFDESLPGREDIHFVWRLGLQGDIILHRRLHGLADQLEESLFSVKRTASDAEQLRLNLLKVRCGVMMLEKVVPSLSLSPDMKNALSSAYFDSAYINSLAGHTGMALKHMGKSVGLGMERRHLKLALRVLTSPLNRVYYLKPQTRRESRTVESKGGARKPAH